MGILGAHVSVAGGLDRAFDRAKALSCKAIQIFSKNQRRWKSPPLDAGIVRKFIEKSESSGIDQVVIHDSYLINLAHPDRQRLEQSREAFFDELVRAEQLNVPYLVFHPGSHLNTDEESGIRRIAESLNRVLERFPDGQVRILLENTAGQGDHLGYCFEHLAEIRRRVPFPERTGICFDTAHAFAAGYDFRSRKTYEAVFSEFDRLIGLEHLHVFHVNDSRSGLAGRVDRHEQIGKGNLGIRPFDLIVNDRRFRHCPMLLETPGGEACYRDNLNLLRSLINSREAVCS